MIKSISSALAAIAVVTFAGFTGQASAQSCSSCAQFGNSFGFPAAPAATGCGRTGGRMGHGHIAAHVDELKRQFDHTSDLNSKIAARNDAWPLPFACRDQISYYDVWAPMLQAGSETNAVLDGHYFTGENELNSLGIDRVRGVVLNAPTNERTVFVNRGADESVNQARIAAIRNTVSTYYGHVAGVDVRLSDQRPQTVRAAEIQQIQEKRIPALPVPVLPAANSTSVSEAVTQ